ncbi:formyl transferase [Ginsengibacter hankyongi]|uniref:phosphoribosylglycinamide formyltransferase 1 n=1 Tax=Ginsengibacter hankyongi TaxID=2607284 RepID=A0A5J5IPA4_9BACT|nr:formyl transferase [Ginsengibacter hankyongi]KAA9041794.1 formyl transferase [Ginsengibacter hankyongi]
MKDKKIVMLAGSGVSSNIIFHAINKRFPVHSIIMEGSENKRKFLKRRLKKLGIITVSGQILFQAIIIKMLRKFSAKRIEVILKENSLNTDEPPLHTVKRVSSINTNDVKDMLQTIQPDVVIVNGTRIISKKILSSVNCPFINTHAGITPKYRGVHGGYWALVNEDKINCGVTVHLVDEGIDTGSILYQDTIEISEKDNFITYPYLQIAKAIPMLQKAIEDALQNKVITIKGKEISKLWYHPTIWQYIYYRLFKKVK